MTTNKGGPPPSRLRQVRIALWAVVVLALVGTAALLLIPRKHTAELRTQEREQPLKASLGGPFTLVGADGKPFSSNALAGKPYAIFFGFTRCGDVCPTTLARLVKLRDAAGGKDALNIVFVTIDPANDGPREVGQYADLFGSPIIGLTGSPAQIDAVKKQYGIYAEPNHDATGHGNMINHTATTLLFDGNGELAGTLSPSEPDPTAVEKLKRLAA
ncbi:SCO family protein [Sphingomonas hankyongi]|uniref:SCO family protein n=1 Tax=Sphingomonas hankyongi TaxID=2908209 RepID=A0ABT0S180_9SPHN|nr:SCO family protein [Sphingomonas hankyongi]MCL6729607.1 SCO family protein [Sphingomonas hankyongi]